MQVFLTNTWNHAEGRTWCKMKWGDILLWGSGVMSCRAAWVVFGLAILPYAIVKLRNAAGTKIDVPSLFRMISIASLARIGNHSLCPLLWRCLHPLIQGFSHRCSSTRICLHMVFTYNFFFVAYAQRLLHRNMWHKHTYKHSNIFFPVNVWFLRHRVFHTHAHKHTRACSFRQILLLTRRCFYTDAFTHKKVCTHKCL